MRLEDYWKFVTDESGSLRRYLFDSNVRDFLGESQVNEEITGSLSDETGPDFWWLNNGVTILATNATVPGKTIQLQEIQIVNGLQTTESIYRHFQSGSVVSSDRSLLVKIIVTSDPQARDAIIRATNNQNPVEIAALHATDKIQRDIEEILERNDWYYERRKNYYRNIGKQQVKLVTPLYVASSVVALIFKNPAKATRLRARFMRNPESYDAVFSTKLPLETWPMLVEIYKQVEAYLGKISIREREGERFVTTWRPLVSLIIVAWRARTFSYSISELRAAGGSPVTEAEVERVWEVVGNVVRGGRPTRRPGSVLIDECCRAAAAALDILGVSDVGRRSIPSAVQPSAPLSEDFLKMVDSVLPPQPWPPGTHSEVAERLNVKPYKARQAMEQLVSSRRRQPQRAGVVYGFDGKVIAVDSGRVPYSVEELNAAGYRYRENEWSSE